MGGTRTINGKGVAVQDNREEKKTLEKQAVPWGKKKSRRHKQHRARKERMISLHWQAWSEWSWG